VVGAGELEAEVWCLVATWRSDDKTGPYQKLRSRILDWARSMPHSSLPSQPCSTRPLSPHPPRSSLDLRRRRRALTLMSPRDVCSVTDCCQLTHSITEGLPYRPLCSRWWNGWMHDDATVQAATCPTTLSGLVNIRKFGSAVALPDGWRIGQGWTPWRRRRAARARADRSLAFWTSERGESRVGRWWLPVSRRGGGDGANTAWKHRVGEFRATCVSSSLGHRVVSG